MESVVGSSVVEEDLAYIKANLTPRERTQFRGARLLLTGCAGFLGFSLLHFFAHYKKDLGIVDIIGLDNFKTGYPEWLRRLEATGNITVLDFDVAVDDFSVLPKSEAHYIYHMASIASPTFYRAFPLETIDANIWGLRKLLDFYRTKPIKGLVFFSSSEVYGDPDQKSIPTSEDYRGFVSCVGPRACYDEAKRFGETLCYVFNQKYGMPITIVRPFNNYGPGMKLQDKRVPADFAQAIMENQDITILSDGAPKRTFCYSADAVVGYLKASLLGRLETFNIGIESPEVSIRELATLYQEIGKAKFGYTGQVVYRSSEESNYLVDNPGRRCPCIDKARQLLGYAPQITARAGIERFLTFLWSSR